MEHQMKETIADAFTALSEQKSIDKITVKDLVAYCGISRASFYYHFQDILELIEWDIQRTNAAITARCRDAGSLDESVRILVHSFSKYYDLLEKLRDSPKRDLVLQLIIDSIQSHFQTAIQEFAVKTRMVMNAADAQAIIRFFSFGLTGLMMQHYQARSPDPDELVRQIIMIVKRLMPRNDPR